MTSNADEHDTDLQVVIAKIKDELGPPESWPSPVQFRGLALCVLNSIYSTGNHSTGVNRVLDRYRHNRSAEGADANRDEAVELVAEIEACGGAEGFADAVGSHWRAWQRKSAPYKAEAVLQAGQLLVAHGIGDRDQLQAALGNSETHKILKRGWLNLPGQRSGLTWRFFLMNTGMPGVKADRMIIRWTSRALGHSTTAGEAEAVLTAAAERLGIDTRQLDHAVWDYERRRR